MLPRLRHTPERISRGISFSPAGLLTPFHLGASLRLQQLRLLDLNTAISGSSGGAIAAVISALNVHSCAGTGGHQILQVLSQKAHTVLGEWGEPTLRVIGPLRNTDDYAKFIALSGCLFVARECRDKGARGTMRTALDTVLDCFLPDNIHEILNNRPAPVTVSYTVVRGLMTKDQDRKGFFVPQLVQQFKSKTDVMDCVRASCNIPFYFNGNNLTVRVRNQEAIDGAIGVHPSRFGCPYTYPDCEELLILPFRASKFRKLFNETRLDEHRKQFDPFHRCAHHVISPDLVAEDVKIWPFTTLELVQMSLSVPRQSKGLFWHPIGMDELIEKYHILYRAGEESVQRWYDRNYPTTC
eukprot:TRINITY_DN13437_c0_g5_i1.p1 TRINITY_DN13437_c0_g5~~TRINITY_DN13437_c0_g5_i1.p1  ORF type:complete len:354 (+),score=49.71 TRINITY_DN13437_c0_g5_i1:158-1219(+)